MSGFRVFELGNGTFAAAHPDPAYAIGCYREDLLDFVFKNVRADIAGFTTINPRYSNRSSDAWIDRSVFFREDVDRIISSVIVGSLTRVVFYNHEWAAQTAEFLDQQMVVSILRNREHRWRI